MRMKLTLSEDQLFFRETTQRFLDDNVDVAELRRRRHDESGFAADYWRRGADLGWTSFLVREEDGGGSISGQGLVDLTIVAHEVGAHAAPGPLVPVNVVAGALSRAGGHADVLAGLLDGSAIATWALSERAARELVPTGVQIVREGDELVVRGVKRPVESAGQAAHLLVTGRTGGGLTQVVVPADAAGVRITPLHTVDLTRRFAEVAFEDVRLPLSALVGDLGAAAADVELQLQQALALVVAESTGAMQRAFDMTLQWAFDRYSFGRPLASYQALKHRFADMKSWVEAAHAISDDAAEAVATGSPAAASLVSAGKAFVGDFGGELMQEAVQLHGGLGVTFEHDVHLFLRRHTLNQTLFGTAAQHRARLTDLAEQQETAA
jgi:alkylation response protein AidB-like acyl-CoA dehydrogenase